MTVPDARRRILNDRKVDTGRSFVLYWMVVCRRPTYNFALQRARDLALELGRPLMVLEALRYDYPWACDRFHDFIIDGMADNKRAFDATAVRYYPFVATPEHSGKGLLERLSQRSCAVVTDDFPAFFVPHMLEVGADRIDVRLEAVDSNGLDTSGLGKADAGRASRRSAPLHLQSRTIRGGRHPRRIVERRPDTTRRNRHYAQLHANAVGKKDSALDRLPPPGARYHG